MKYKVIEHFDNGEDLVWQQEAEAIDVVKSFTNIHSLIEDPQSARFNAVLPKVTSITIEVIRE